MRTFSAGSESSEDDCEKGVCELLPVSCGVCGIDILEEGRSDWDGRQEKIYETGHVQGRKICKDWLKMNKTRKGRILLV